MKEGMDYGRMPFPGTICPVPDVGFNNFIELHHILDMIDTL